MAERKAAIQVCEAADGLAPIFTADARALILGSFPSAESLRRRQYYAHPRNQFWRIIECLFGIARDDSYAQRCRQLAQRDLVLWDVIARCRRRGSSDSAIRVPEANDFADLYRRCPRIVAVFFNGAAAEHHYRALVGDAIKPAGCAALVTARLPSTSPAYAAMSLADKTDRWRAVCAAPARAKRCADKRNVL
ncbi:MAG: DNA-deoxyinosine glycosylase [bacterium]